jgi:predicted urease superfamily metal-dependent hydrolase
MKKITKVELQSVQQYIAALNIVGLAPAKAKALMKLHSKVSKVIAELVEEQKALIEKYEIAITEDGRSLDTTSPNFNEYLNTYRELIAETIDITEYCVLTEDEAILAVSKIDAPIAVVAEIAALLTEEDKESEN